MGLKSANRYKYSFLLLALEQANKNFMFYIKVAAIHRYFVGAIHEFPFLDKVSNEFFRDSNEFGRDSNDFGKLSNDFGRLSNDFGRVSNEFGKGFSGFFDDFYAKNGFLKKF